MVNFWAMDTVPAQFRGRTLYRHNQNVTLMRTTPEECARIGRFIVDKLNRMEGPVRFLIPEGGRLAASTRRASRSGTRRRTGRCSTPSPRGFRPAPNRKLVRLPHNVNDPAFCDALVAGFDEIVGAPALEARHGRITRRVRLGEDAGDVASPDSTDGAMPRIPARIRSSGP